MSSQDLKPCPFCKAAVSIRSNRDWNTLSGEHEEDCPLEDFEISYLPSEQHRQKLIDDWNRRAERPTLPADEVRRIAIKHASGLHYRALLTDRIKTIESAIREAMGERG